MQRHHLESAASNARETDEALFLRFREEADHDAFRAVFERTARQLAAAASRAGVSAAEVDDVVQETYVAAFTAARRFDPDRSLVDWLRGILFKKAVDANRRRKRRQRLAESVEQRDIEQRDGDLETVEALHAVRDAILRMPTRYAEVVRWYYQEQVPIVDIAARHGCPPSTIRTRLSRGVAWLRKAMPAGLTPAVLGLFGVAGCVRPARDGTGAGRTPATSALQPAWVAAVIAAPLLIGAALLGRSAADAAPQAGPPRASTASVAGTAGGGPAATREAELRDAVAGAARSAPAGDPRRSTPPAPRLRVVVLHDGEPVPGITVGVEAMRPAMPATVRDVLDGMTTATTNELGVAVFAPGTSRRVRLRYDRWEPLVRDVPSDGELVVNVRDVVAVQGRVEDHDGNPVEDAEVRRHLIPGMGSPGVVVARTGVDGSFRFTVANPRRPRLWASKPGRGVSSLSSPDEMEPGQPCELRFVLRPASHAVTGYVWSPEGRGLPDVRLLVRPVDAPNDRCVYGDSGVTGEFEARDLRPGPHRVTALARDGSFATADVDVGPGMSPCYLTLSPGARIRGLATGPDGKAFAGLPVIVRPVSLEHRVGKFLIRVGRTAEDGSFDVVGVPPVEVVVAVLDPSNVSTVARGTVRANGIVECTPSPLQRPHTNDLGHWALSLLELVEEP